MILEGIPLVSEIILYIILTIFGLMCIIIFPWQINVLRGKAMKNTDGTTDDWHEQKIFYGIALADVTIAVPLTVAGIVLVLMGLRFGYYVTGLASLWFLWANVMTTATSLRFEKPAITLMWFITFPLGAISGLAYIVWSLLYFHLVF